MLKATDQTCVDKAIAVADGKPCILIIIAHYLPGHKAGGPLRSIANLAETLGDKFDFKILTSDRDLGDAEPFTGIVMDEWLQVGKAQVMYMSPEGQSIGNILRLLRSTDYDVIYINSFFARRWSMLPIVLRKLRLIKNAPLVIAPRGEFSVGALEIKAKRKTMFLRIVRFLGLYKGVVWHASTSYEETDIIREFGKEIREQKQPADQSIVHTAVDLAASPHVDQNVIVCTALNLPSPALANLSVAAGRVKESGSLRAVFLSRIARKKNLDMALRLLKDVSGRVQFDIYGPTEDSEYWAECQGIIAELPDNVRVEYCGHVSHDQVSEVFGTHDLFVFPTHGENFGHVISEALISGCPVLLSDQTPWRGLEEIGVGWDIPLDQPDKLREALQKCVDMGPEEHLVMRHKARTFAIERSTDPASVEQNRMLFLRAIGMDIRMSDNKVVN